MYSSYCNMIQIYDVLEYEKKAIKIRITVLNAFSLAPELAEKRDACCHSFRNRRLHVFVEKYSDRPV